MSDISPQSVFGLSDADFQRLADIIEARGSRPNRFGGAVRRVVNRLAQPSSFNGMGVIAGLIGFSLPDPVWSQASIGASPGCSRSIAVALNDGSNIALTTAAPIALSASSQAQVPAPPPA
jgi:hypothetical protein